MKKEFLEIMDALYPAKVWYSMLIMENLNVQTVTQVVKAAGPKALITVKNVKMAIMVSLSPDNMDKNLAKFTINVLNVQ